MDESARDFEPPPPLEVEEAATFFDLVEAVVETGATDAEVRSAVLHLFSSGRVRFRNAHFEMNQDEMNQDRVLQASVVKEFEAASLFFLDTSTQSEPNQPSDACDRSRSK